MTCLTPRQHSYFIVQRSRTLIGRIAIQKAFYNNNTDNNSNVSLVIPSFFMELALKQYILSTILNMGQCIHCTISNKLRPQTVPIYIVKERLFKMHKCTITVSTNIEGSINVS